MPRGGALEPITPGGGNRLRGRQSIGAASKTPCGDAQSAGARKQISADGLEEEFQFLAAQLGQTSSEDWERRVEALERLAAAATAEVCAHEAFVPLLTRHLREPLTEQVADMRSAVLKVACNAIVQLANLLGDSFAPLAEHLLPVILANTCKSVQVMVDDANSCILSVLGSTQSSRLVQKVVDSASGERNREFLPIESQSFLSLH